MHKNLMRASVAAALLAASTLLSAAPVLALNITTLSKIGAGAAAATTSAKASPVTLYGVLVNGAGTNSTAYGSAGSGGPYYVQLFNAKASVLGTAKPTLEIGLAASSSVTLFNPPLSLGGDSLTAALTTASQGSATASGNITLIYQ